MTDYKLVPVEPTPEMLDAAIQDGICVDGRPVWKKDVVFQAKWKYQQMLAAAPAQQVDPVSTQVRYRRPEKGQPDWSVWQPAPIMLNRPYGEIDSQGWEVEYRLLYTTPQPAPDVTQLVKALEWYAEKVKGCRKIGAEGDNARQALDHDGGFRALDALAIHRKQEEKE